MTVLSKVWFRRIEIQACPPTPRHFELYQRFEILQAGRVPTPMRAAIRWFSSVSSRRKRKKKKEKEKGREEEKSQR